MAHQDNQIAIARRDFVCVRLGQMNHVDVARFEFDYDTTWTSFFLDADLNIYSRYGGRDDRVADSRMSRESLLETMSNVLSTHRTVQQTPADQRAAVIRTQTHPLFARPSQPESIPLLKDNHEGCVHCHQVQEYRHLQAFHDGKFDRKLLFGYPLPENLGLTVTPQNGQLVKSIEPGSAVEFAGIKAGDVIRRINDIPIRSEYDIRWALHHAPDGQPILLSVMRSTPRAGGASANSVDLELQLKPSATWRQTDLGWRKSLRSVPLQLGFLGYTLGGEGLAQAGFREGKSVLKVISLRPPGLAKNLQLQKGDLIVSVGGNTEFRTMDHFKSRLLERYRPGDTVKLEIIRDGRTILAEGLFPDWFTTENSVP
ncbi:MAG: hypothetical protein JWM11_118 [Planctomycetaceae bacterium]|nr:hypothetical protein [Planctomycetaceae bacterium]